MNDRTKKQFFSYIITFLVYLFFFNWKMAVLLTASISFHECGHLFVAKKRGLKTSGFFLYPFVGGVATVDEQYKTYWDQALVVLAGPAAGLLLALVTGGIAHLTHSALLASATLWMCIFNMFNLLPISSLDGGQILQTVTYSISNNVGIYSKIASNLLAFPLMYISPVIGILLLIFGGYPTYLEWVHYNRNKNGKYSYNSIFNHQPIRLDGVEIGITIGSYVLVFLGLFLLATTMYAMPNVSINSLVK